MRAFDRLPRSMEAEDAWREERLAIVAALCRADALLARDPDVAALELDGLLYRIARIWCQARAGGLLLSERMEQPASDAPLFAQRLRLALRAPDVRARLAHLWWLVDETFPAQTTISRQRSVTVGAAAAFRQQRAQRGAQTPPSTEIVTPRN